MQDVARLSLYCSKRLDSMHLFCRAVFVLQFSRTVAPETSKGSALIAFMRQNGWKRTSMLSSTDSVYLESARELRRQMLAADMRVLKPATFDAGQFDASVLSDIKRSGNRIVLFLAYDKDTQTVAVTAGPIIPSKVINNQSCLDIVPGCFNQSERYRSRRNVKCWMGLGDHAYQQDACSDRNGRLAVAQTAPPL